VGLENVRRSSHQIVLYQWARVLSGHVVSMQGSLFAD